jgi:uncharacterized iron-regulated membrane protein
MTVRTLVFWSHLIAGALAGLVILVMTTTGTLLMFERQLIAWSDSGYRSVPPFTTASRLPISTLVASLEAAAPRAAVTAIAIAAAPDAPVAFTAGGRTLYADAYSGAVLGEGSATTRRAMRELRTWHRWLGATGEARSVGKAFTGGATVLFAFIVASGAYLWIPRAWTKARVRMALLFKAGLHGKARDFNWHHVVGIWSCVPLFVLAVSAWPISFAWANAAIYRAFGEPVPAGRGGGAPPAGERARSERAAAIEQERARSPRRAATPRSVTANGLDALLARAERQERNWRTITLRWPESPAAPVQFAIDRGDGGQPHLRSTLTLTRAGEVAAYETFASQTRGRRVRALLRFAHTGEVAGLPGQVIAGAASAGGALLVWTGLALTFRRFRRWLSRRDRDAAAASVPVERASHRSSGFRA